MHQEFQLILTPEEAASEELFRKKVAEKAELNITRISLIRILRKSIDARSALPKINIGVEVSGMKNHLKNTKCMPVTHLQATSHR